MYDFKATEQRILQFWRDHHIFAKSISSREGAKRFVFFEGPPTANGRPGIHHVLARSFKDLFCRYKTMRGYQVWRKAGWDTHGLPVELEVEKELGFKNKKDIEAYGIGPFNKKAKESVWKYKKEWEELTARMAFWLDLAHPYVTYDTNYIESAWNIVKEIHKKDLLYLAHKVVPFCTRCGTALSSHEVAQGYKTVTDTSVYIKFALTPGQHISGRPVGEHTYVLAWTTTPWTLPGNVALAVGSDIDYALVRAGKETHIIAQALVERVLGHTYEGEVVKGKDLVGFSYVPLFSVEKLRTQSAYQIYSASFVSTTDGTGVVHTAVMYGEDDYNLGTQLGLPKVHTVNEQGKFQNVSEELDGKYVKAKETEEAIIAHLTRQGNLLKTESYEHEYPYCWRCSNPLLYYAKESWFVKMSAMKDSMIRNNQLINWVPDHIKDGRFGQWLNDLKDWAISRERYWGTPLPIWKCEQCAHVRVIGSYQELERYAVSRKNTYHILRHSLSTRNEESGSITINSMLDHDTYHLTEEGKKRVEAVAEYLSHDRIHAIYTSPFHRTKETAEIVGKALHVKIHEDVRLSEIRHAMECEGKSHLHCPARAGMRETMDTRHHNGESWNDVRERLMDFMNEMEATHTNKHILIVSHGDPLLLLQYMGQGYSGEDILEKDKSGQDRPYPALAGLTELEWRRIPRNDQGELDPHRPFIDRITFKCPECRASMKKIPDLMDVWFDSGAMPYAQWHWPFEHKDMFKKQFPADFIVEAIDQTRGWFYTLLAISTLLGRGIAYKNVMSLGHILDEKGQKMSKSKGNIILPMEVFDRAGVDAVRWYFYTMNAPGDYKMFTMKDLEGKLRGMLYTVQNCVRFYELYKHELPEVSGAQHDLDTWITSRMNRLILDTTHAMEAYDSLGAARGIETFVMEDFSNWWLRRSRKRPEALPLLRTLLRDLARLMAPFMPYVAEDVYLRLSQGSSEAESVHLDQWPVASKRLVNEKLEAEMEDVRQVVTRGLAIRKEKNMKVRQPLASATVVRAKKFRKDIEALVRDELNVKKILYVDTGTDVMLDEVLDQALTYEGYARECMRIIQDMRKEAGYHVQDSAVVHWESSDVGISEALQHWARVIQDETSLSSFVDEPFAHHVFDLEKEAVLAPGKMIHIGLKK